MTVQCETVAFSILSRTWAFKFKHPQDSRASVYVAFLIPNIKFLGIKIVSNVHVPPYPPPPHKCRLTLKLRN